MMEELDLHECRGLKGNRTLIIEELETHGCRKVIDYRIEEQILWLFDGESWYPCKLRSTENLHQKNQPQDEQSLKTITL